MDKLGHGEWEALKGRGGRVGGGDIDIAGLRPDDVRFVRK
jgi:hypothetical protein